MDIAGILFSFTLKACKVIAEKYYLLYTPFIMRQHDRFDHPNHIFDLLFKVLFFGIGTILLYHFPILFWFIYHYNFSVIGNIFRGIVTIIMSILLSFVGGVENSVLTIGSLFMIKLICYINIVTLQLSHKLFFYCTFKQNRFL